MGIYPDIKTPEELQADVLAEIQEVREILATHGRALAFILAGITKQPAQITGLQELLDELGREMPGNIIPASGLVGS